MTEDSTEIHAEKQAEALREELPLAHIGLTVVVIASFIVGAFASLLYGALVAGVFAALFLGALGIQCLAGFDRESLLRAYLVTFGWANWL
ncbi:hypothetical protein [Streptomyces sp. HUAS TT7]|uniref:hypothetical protein n=1 Tax=Streptomyces sp. HUAS TT7 TaxID=3447507 RepID=UPI003F65B570